MPGFVLLVQSWPKNFRKITRDHTNGRCGPRSPVRCCSMQSTSIHNSTTCTDSCVDTVVDCTPAFQHFTAGLRVIFRSFIGHYCTKSFTSYCCCCSLSLFSPCLLDELEDEIISFCNVDFDMNLDLRTCI